jgi:hypothetical protein
MDFIQNNIDIHNDEYVCMDDETWMKDNKNCSAYLKTPGTDCSDKNQAGVPAYLKCKRSCGICDVKNSKTSEIHSKQHIVELNSELFKTYNIALGSLSIAFFLHVIQLCKYN